MRISSGLAAEESRAEACILERARARPGTTLSTALDRRRGCSLSGLLVRSLALFYPVQRSAVSLRSGESVYEIYSAEGTHLARARELRRRVVRETRHPVTRESTCERTRKRARCRPSVPYACETTRTYGYPGTGIHRGGPPFVRAATTTPYP